MVSKPRIEQVDLENQNYEAEMSNNLKDAKLSKIEMKDILKAHTVDGQIDISGVLLEMEKKINKKFSKYDDILKTIDEGSSKMRNEIMKIKNQIDQLGGKKNPTNANDFFANNIGGITADDNANDLFDILNDNIGSGNSNMGSTLEKIVDINGNIIENPNKSNKPIDYNKLLRDMTKKISDLDKNYNIISTNLNPDIIKAELKRLNDLAEKSLGDNQVIEIKESISNKLFI